MTYDELIDEVLTRLNEGTSAPPVYWNREDVQEALVDGLLDLSDEVEWNEEVVHLLLLARRPYYDLRTCIEREILSFRGGFSIATQRWLTPRDTRELDFHIYTLWEDNTGSEDQAVLRGLWWLGLHPRPEGDGNTIRAYVTTMPADPVMSEELPEIPEIDEALREYAIAEAYGQDQQTQQYLIHFASYERAKERIRSYVENRLNYDRNWVFMER